MTQMFKFGTTQYITKKSKTYDVYNSGNIMFSGKKRKFRLIKTFIIVDELMNSFPHN